MIVLPCIIIYFAIGYMAALGFVYYYKKHPNEYKGDKDDLLDDAILTFIFWIIFAVGAILISPITLLKHIIDKS